MFASVSESQVERLDNSESSNCFFLEGRRIDCFGFFPKFQLNDKSRVFVVQAEPISGIWGAILRALFPWKEKNPKEVKSDKDGADFVRLYSIRAQFGSKIKGCIIPTNRTDKFTEVLRRNNSGEHREYVYEAIVTVSINPILFYNYLNTPAHSAQLKSDIEGCLLSKINEELECYEGDPDFTVDNYKFSSVETERAGYTIEKCTIRYVRAD